MSVPIKVFAIDQSPTSSGWAKGAPGEKRPNSGVFRMGKWGEDEGPRLEQFYDWMMQTAADCTHVFWEAPVDVQPFKKWDQKRQRMVTVSKSFDITSKQNMQIGIIILVAQKLKCERAQVTSGDWRKRFLGHAAVPGLSGDALRAELKGRALRMCALRGWFPENDDEAEALGIWDYGCSVASPRHAGKTDVIFRRLELQQDRKNYIGED